MRNNLIGVDVLYWNDFANFHDVSVQYFGMMSFDRAQLYSEYEKARNSGLAAICFGLVFIGLFVDKIFRKTKESLLHTFDRQRTVFQDFQEMTENPQIKSLRARLEICIQALEYHLQEHPFRRSQMPYLEYSTTPPFQSEAENISDQELSTPEALQSIAIGFLQDLTHGRDVEVHLALLLCSAAHRTWLMPLFRVSSSWLCQVAVRTSLFAMLWLELVDTGVSSVAKGVFLGALLVDASLRAMFGAIQSRSIAVDSKSQHAPATGSLLSGLLVIVPSRLRTPFGAKCVYLLLLLIGVGEVLWAPEAPSGLTWLVSYIAPVLVLLRNEDIWPALGLFLDAIGAAGSIVYIMAILLLMLSGMTNVLLHGVFSTNNYAVDSQFQDFYRSLSTLSVYLIDGSNFIEVVEPALAVSGLYVFFFISISLFSIFFVSAILITLFMDHYAKGTGGQLTPQRRKRWAALTLVHLLMTAQTAEPDVQISTDQQRSLDMHSRTMTMPMFERLLLQCHLFGEMSDSWISTAQSLLHSAISLLAEVPTSNTDAKYTRELVALATVCSKLNFEGELQHLVNHELLRDTDTPRNLGDSSGLAPEGRDTNCFQAALDTEVSSVLVRTGLCSENLDEQIEFVRGILGSVSLNEARMILASTSVPLFMERSDHNPIRKIIAAALRVSQTCSDLQNLHESKVQDESSESPSRSNKWFFGAREGDAYHQSVVCSTLLEHVHEMFRLDSASTDPITQSTSALISLVYMHTRRLRMLFNALDVNSDGMVSLVEFDHLWALTNVIVRIASSTLMQKEAEVMLLHFEIEFLEQELQGVVPTDLRIVWSDRLQQLQSAYEQLDTEIKLELGGYFSPEDDRLAILQIAALLNVGAVAYLGNSGSDQVALYWVLVAFPLLFAFEFVFRVWSHGLSQTLWDTRHPDLHAAWWLGAAAIATALIGSALLAFDRDHNWLPKQDARTLASLTVLLVIVYNKKFGRMTLAFARAAGSVIPIAVAILMIVILYAVASVDLFGNSVVDPGTAKPYFGTFSQSLTTMFRMFTGNWHDTMYAAAEATTEGAQLWFTVYVFVISVFCCELFVGVVIAGYAEVQEVSSPRMYFVLAPAFEECSHEKRTALVKQALKLAREMRPYNELNAAILGHIQTRIKVEPGQAACLVNPAQSPIMPNVRQPSFKNGDDFGDTEAESLPGMISEMDLTELDPIANGSRSAPQIVYQ